MNSSAPQRASDWTLPDSTDWHTMTADEALAAFSTDAKAGLTDDEALRRLATLGPNEIAEARRHSWLGLLARQFRDFMILVLIAAAVVSGIMGSLTDATAILVIVLLNALVGAVQEYRARRAIEALRRMAAPQANIVRSNRALSVPSSDVVPGDIVLLEAGDAVPADVRLISEGDLRIDESTLTGESLSVAKTDCALEDSELTLGDRINLAYKGTLVTKGTARGIVVATGRATELGRIGELLESSHSKTPLEERLGRFGRHLSLVILGLCALIFLAGLLRGEPALLMFLTAVSLAVAAVPEALPAVVTISLALGARALSQRNTLVRRLPAVEALGSVTFVCADKTGTLTENRMTLERIRTAEREVDALPARADTSELSWQHLGRALALNSEVKLVGGEPSGDPTEIALYKAAEEAGYRQAELLAELPRVTELSFDENRKRMTTVHRGRGQFVAYVKGAPEAVLPLCSSALVAGQMQNFDAASLGEAASELASEGSRVLAIAMRRLDELPEDRGAVAALESDLEFLALVGLVDPPRAEVPQAVAECRTAGIVPVMITGDHPATARHVAEHLGIIERGAAIMTGSELAKLSDQELERQCRDIGVYARVDPAQKIRIVKALAERGEFVAMTGDGVNDAPALTSATIGVAMGKRGTDVARESADIVLLDDNFATIVAAIREGRRIYDDIRKFVKYTMTSNSGEIWTLALAPVFGLPIPLLPIQILWINLLTDGLPGLAFTTEPPERGVMQRPPRPPEENMFARGMGKYMLWMGLFIGGISIAGQYWTYHRGLDYWRTMTFTILVIAQLFNALAVRSDRDSLFKLGLGSNPQLLAACVITAALQLAVIYVPVLNGIFGTMPLPMYDLAACFVLGSLVLVLSEIQKLLASRS